MSNFPHLLSEATPAEPMPAEHDVLSSLALANKIFLNNLEQQTLVAKQQAMNLLLLATLAKAVTLILDDTSTDMAAIHTAIATVKSVFDPPAATPAAAEPRLPTTLAAAA